MELQIIQLARKVIVAVALASVIIPSATFATTKAPRALCQRVQPNHSVMAVQHGSCPQGFRKIVDVRKLRGLKGRVGARGYVGPSGVDGKTIWSGTENSVAAGKEGDLFFNTTTQRMYGPKTAEGWGEGVSVVGPAGEQGEKGDAGEKGEKGDRGDQGEAGSAGLRGLRGERGEKGESGERGTDGAPGVAGAAGVAGADGSSLLNGAVNPSSTTGMDGDFYINTASNMIFGPKSCWFVECGSKHQWAAGEFRASQDQQVLLVLKDYREFQEPRELKVCKDWLERLVQWVRKGFKVSQAKQVL